MGSYTVYCTQFIRSASGITPVWLAGDSRDWDPILKRRPRNWSVFHNLLSVSEQELMVEAEKYIGSDQHWICNGRDVNDAAYMRWLKKHIAVAASLESILDHNSLHRVKCYVSAWDTNGRNTTISDQYCKTTEEFDNWAANAKVSISSVQKAGGWAYPIVDFLTDNLKNPPAVNQLPEKLLLKKYGGYLNYNKEGILSSFYSNIKKGKVFSKEEYLKMLQDPYHFPAVKGSIPVNAAAQQRPYNAVIRFCSGEKAGLYVMRRVRSQLRLSVEIDCAKHYPDQKAAERAMARIKPKVSHIGDLEVVIDKTELKRWW